MGAVHFAEIILSSVRKEGSRSPAHALPVVSLPSADRLPQSLTPCCRAPNNAYRTPARSERPITAGPEANFPKVVTRMCTFGRRFLYRKPAPGRQWLNGP